MSAYEEMYLDTSYIISYHSKLFINEFMVSITSFESFLMNYAVLKIYQYHSIRTSRDILPSSDLLSKSGLSLLPKIPPDFLTNHSLFMTRNKVSFYWQSHKYYF